MKHKILTMILLASLTVSILTGCGQPETASTADTQTTETTAQPEEPEQAEEVVTETAETEVASAEETEATTEPSIEEVTPEPQPTEEPEPTEETAPEYTYTDMSATMYATQTVNVRNLPSTDGEKVGSLSANQEVTITGQASTGWYRFTWTDGSEAYVSDKYLSDSKVEKPAASETPSNGGNSTAGTGSTVSNWADGYPRNQWIDMGEYFFYIANSQAEANQVYGDYMLTHTKGEDCHIYHPDLEVRYPDRRMYIMAFTAEKGNVPVAVISTYINEPWYNPKFIWD